MTHERPTVRDLLGQTVTLYFPDGTFTTGTLRQLESYELTVNGWRVEVPGRFLSLEDGTLLY